MRWPGLGRRVSAGDKGLVRRPRVRLMGSASLTSRYAPACYPKSAPILPMLERSTGMVTNSYHILSGVMGLNSSVC